MTSLGLASTHLWHLLALLVLVVLWRLKLGQARKQHIVIYHNSSMQVSYWEEVLFRGIIWGLLLLVWSNTLFALIASSLLFGLFHLRNLWWAPQRQVIFMCLYTGLVFGPVVGFIRWWSGDIYLGIAVHALHNFVNMYITKSELPSDNFLRSQMKRMNGFERVFSGPTFWKSL